MLVFDCMKLSQILNQLRTQKRFPVSNLSTDSESGAFFFSALSSLDSLSCALRSWDLVSCKLASIAFTMSRTGADSLLAGQLQVPVQQTFNIYLTCHFKLSFCTTLHPMSLWISKILELIHTKLGINTCSQIQEHTHTHTDAL